MELDSHLTEYFRLTAIQKIALKKLGILSVRDLLYHFPTRYGDTAEARSIDSLSKGVSAVIYGKIKNLKASKGWKSKITMATATVEDESGKINCVWFNQPYVAKMFQDGMMVRIEGKVSERRQKNTANAKIPHGLNFGQANNRDGADVFPAPTIGSARTTEELAEPSLLAPESVGNDSSVQRRSEGGAGNTSAPSLYFSNPKIEAVEKLPTGVGDSLFGDGSEAHNMYPVYPESRGVTSLWFYHALQKTFRAGILDRVVDPIPQDILDKYHLPTLKTALIWIHAPQNTADAISARKRFSFEEIFFIQLGKQRARILYENNPSFDLDYEDKMIDQYIARFPFQATEAQSKAIHSILEDMNSGKAMLRLLEGDVGSGKTAVAATAAYAVITAKSFPPMQVAYMCPTEILATQHFESFIQYFSYLGIQIALITGSGCRKFPSKVNPKGWTDISKTQLLKWVTNGEINIVIGTHALIQKTVSFRNLALAIIDEQHRFGTADRAKLVKKNGIKAPHLLSMTATPIPRTLALTMYGDLDLTILDQSPTGRKPIITKLVLPQDRNETYEKIRQELNRGRQLYVICPRIDAPDPDKEMALQAKSVKEEAVRLKKEVFPEFTIDVLHGKLKSGEKDNVMASFKNGDIKILCATSVVEVGVNVPNATVIIIEGAERFGLSQLHQLRGRVMRSSEQAYCYAFTETTSVKSTDRLKALATARNGFELAELDLVQRGAGQLSGEQQWGVSDVAMEALRNLKMVEAARDEAKRLINEDIELNQYPLLSKLVNAKSADSHFE